MVNQETSLGRLWLLVIPVGILAAIVTKSFLSAVVLATAVGLLIANVKAVLLVGRVRQSMDKNPLLKLSAQLKGVDVSTQIRFIFMESLIGGVVFGAWAAGIAAIKHFFF